MTDEQDRAEQLDDDIVADDEDDRDASDSGGGDRFERIAALDGDYPPDQPLGVEDEGRFEIEDDLARREARQVEESP